MRKQWGCLLAVVVSLLLLMGCGDDFMSGEATDWEPTMHETVNETDEVSMTIQEGTVSPTGVSLVFENHTNEEYIYGESFILEEHIEGSWYQVPVEIEDNYGFNTIGYSLEAGESEVFEVDWEWLYGTLDEGSYRIVKDISAFREAGDYDPYILAATFTIE